MERESVVRLMNEGACDMPTQKLFKRRVRERMAAIDPASTMERPSSRITRKGMTGPAP